MVHAQQAKKVQRIGFLGSGTLGQFVAFRQALRDLGYVKEKNITIEYPKPEGNFARAPARAAELLRLKVDVIVTSGATDTRAAKESTTTIPIVFFAGSRSDRKWASDQSGATWWEYHRVILAGRGLIW